ncbi:Mov34/MPN/PAD-1 family protein [Herbaspirillum seropedicae]|uniref:Mov34/MPN/PAD-1 family protein n=1 Tax=Herbaspirillum seropedicae TaxID=964 RepID=UPI003D994C80
MLTINLPNKEQRLLVTALRRAGSREIGGILMAEHVGHNEFTVRKLTIHKPGSFAYFVRRIDEIGQSLWGFFQVTKNEYERFNYLGEWHSHPSFPPYPSRTDDQSMLELILDPKMAANFAVLIIVKLDVAGALVGTAHTYLPDKTRHLSTLKLATR